MTDEDKQSFISWFVFWVLFGWNCTGFLFAGLVIGVFTMALHEYLLPFGSINKSVSVGVFTPRPRNGWEN